MHIEVSSDINIKGSEAITAQCAGLVQHDLACLSGHVTSIEVDLGDANADTSGPDEAKRGLEARPKKANTYGRHGVGLDFGTVDGGRNRQDEKRTRKHFREINAPSQTDPASVFLVTDPPISSGNKSSHKIGVIL